jgi:hypothetical protein
MQDTGSEPCPLLSESGTFRENPDVSGLERNKVSIWWAFTGEGEEEQTNSKKDLHARDVV